MSLHAQEPGRSAGNPREAPVEDDKNMFRKLM